jgi:5-formyltetrahydrofolate cyclo-ligase
MSTLSCEDEKRALRRRLLAARAARAAPERTAAGSVLAERCLPLLSGARAVAAYVSVGNEPGTRPLLDALVASGVPVLLPVLLPDRDLDWAPASPAGMLAPGARGTRQPPSPGRGVLAVSGVDAVVVPGLAGDLRGARLGRGGGSYDRALARVPAGVPVLLLLYDDELLPEVPVESHDRPVTHLVRPAGVAVATGWTLPAP